MLAFFTLNPAAEMDENVMVPASYSLMR
jgi:hypothetical protein